MLEALGVPLISQHLLLLECLLSEADFNFDDGAFVDDARAWLTLVNEELLPSDHDCLTFLEVAHEPTEEVLLENLCLDQLNCLTGLTVC